MNKRLTALAVCLFLTIVSVVSAQRLISLQPGRAIELALQNNEAVKKGRKGGRTRQGKSSRVQSHISTTGGSHR